MASDRSFIPKFRDSGRKFLNAAIPILEQQRAETAVDLYQPVRDEVLGGLFARVFGFLQTFVLDFHLWADDLGQVVLRMMLESVIYMKFLAAENGSDAYLGPDLG